MQASLIDGIHQPIQDAPPAPPSAEAARENTTLRRNMADKDEGRIRAMASVQAIFDRQVARRIVPMRFLCEG